MAEPLPRFPLSTLSPAAVATFIAHGYLRVPAAFDPAIAATVVAQACAEYHLDPADPRTWQTKRFLLQRSLDGGAIVNLYSERVTGAIADLVGAGRSVPCRGTGYVLGSVPGAEPAPWAPLHPGHVDGNWFHHHLVRPEQALVGLFMFTDMAPDGGPTWIRPGSHRLVARLLAASEPAGLSSQQLCEQANALTAQLPIVAVGGLAGDLLLMHPFTFHGSSKNCGTRLRVVSNMCINLHAPTQLERPDPAAYSPVEWAIVQALRAA